MTKVNPQVAFLANRMAAKMEALLAEARRPAALKSSLPVAVTEFDAWAQVRDGRVIAVWVQYINGSKILDGDYVVPLRMASFGTRAMRQQLKEGRKAVLHRRKAAEAKYRALLEKGLGG